MNGASFSPSLSAAAIRSLSILTSRFTAPSRVGSSSAWRHSSDFHTAALERSGAFLQRVSTTPQRILVPPISTARMLSWASKIHDGARCRQPIRPASSG